MKLKGPCSLEEKLWPTRQHSKKQRCYFANKCPSSQRYGFSGSHVWMWELDYKELDYKADRWRIDVFELWCWRRCLRVPWTARRSNQLSWRKSVLNIYWKDWCWSWNSNSLATWCEELNHWERPWCWERLKAGGEGDNRGWDGLMASLTLWTWVWVILGIGDGQGSLVCCSPWGCKESDMTEQLNWQPQFEFHLFGNVCFRGF